MRPTASGGGKVKREAVSSQQSWQVVEDDDLGDSRPAAQRAVRRQAQTQFRRAEGSKRR